MNKLKAVSLLLLVAGVANAGPLDLLFYGVKGNPDRYASMDLRAVYSHDVGNIQVNSVDVYGSGHSFYPQYYQANDRALKGQFLLPLDENSTLVLGGLVHLGDQAIDQTSDYRQGTQGISGQSANLKGYVLEAGFKFYIHD